MGTVDRNKLNKIDGLIQRLKNKADQLEGKIKKLNELLEDSEEVVGQDKFQDQIKSLEKNLRKIHDKIDKLKDKSEHIERSVDPEAMSHNEMMDLITKLLNDCKSKKTLDLEKI